MGNGNMNIQDIKIEFKDEKGNNYRFIDRQISRMFQVGGTDVHLHKYLGPKNQQEGTADQPIYDVIKETNIQIDYDLEAVTAKADADEQAQIDAKQNALNKLMALGLTEEEALALGK